MLGDDFARELAAPIEDGIRKPPPLSFSELPEMSGKPDRSPEFQHDLRTLSKRAVADLEVQYGRSRGYRFRAGSAQM